MQIKKDDVKLKIKKNAKQLFFEMCYDDVSMRDVAEKSEMTVGNIYRYYENKEILFDEIVKNTYDKVVKLIKITDFAQNFIKSKAGKSEKAVYKSSKFKKHILEVATKMITDNSIEIYILLENSAGSKYENIKEQVLSLVDETIIRLLGLDEDMAEIYSFTILSTLSHILKKYATKKDKLSKNLDAFFVKLFESFS